MTDEMNAMLLKEYSMEEVELAFSQMHLLKSPSLDGFAACFYQNSWAMVRQRYVWLCWSFLIKAFFIMI